MTTFKILSCAAVVQCGPWLQVSILHTNTPHSR